MHIPTGKHQEELRESCGRMGARIELPGGVKDTTRRHTESTNLGPLRLTEPEPQIKEHAGFGPRSPTHL